MTKIAKKPLFSSQSSLRIAIRIILFAFLYIFLPAYLSVSVSHKPLLLALFYPANIAIVFYLFALVSRERYRLEYQNQTLQEQLNILHEENTRELQNYASLQAKIIRYNSLEGIVGQINESLELDYVANRLTSIAFSLISRDQGTCALYLVDNKTRKLGLFKTKKDQKQLVIKAKEGDIFDQWVLRHTSPLLVEDIKKDFRFDLEKLKSSDLRPFSSLVSSTLISEHRFLGILRLDSPNPDFYSQEDLRFLSKICELGAVALENSELFKETQDLAIHDPLTSVYTKGYFLERLKEACKRAQRQKTEFSLLMLDVDFFKDYNDKFGHTAGDTVLKTLTGNISESLKELKPIVGRFGGEEFCVILEGIGKLKARKHADILCERIARQKIILRRQVTKVRVSIGIAAFPLDAAEEVELMQEADKALYEAKQKGRNQVCSA